MSHKCIIKKSVNISLRPCVRICMDPYIYIGTRQIKYILNSILKYNICSYLTRMCSPISRCCTFHSTFLKTDILSTRTITVFLTIGVGFVLSTFGKAIFTVHITTGITGFIQRWTNCSHATLDWCIQFVRL